MKIGSIDISDLKLGATQINEVRHGANLIWQKTAGGYDADYQAVLDYATANAIPLPDDTQKSIDNQLLIDYKATGAWAKDDVFFKFKGTADPSFKLICWKRLIQANAYGSLTWSTDGVKGNGTNAYIDSLFSMLNNGVNYAQNNAGVCFGMVTTPSELTVLMGARNATDNGINLIPNRPSSSKYFNINSSLLTAQFPAAVGAVGLNGLYRLNSGLSELYNPGYAVKQDTLASSPLVSEKIFILARNLSGTADYFATNTLDYVTFGASKAAEHSSIKTLLV